LDFVGREAEVLKFWKENQIFEKSQEQGAKSDKSFTFYDGPPTANGKPHMGHVLTRSIKDIIPRFHALKGENVLRKAGWDTHGLPVELEVEKMLGMDGKQDIEAYGIEPFIKKCKESVWKYKGEWEVMSDRVGFWADMENPYITYDDNYIESVWWAFSEINRKGLLYKGYKVVPYCPRCGTALSSHEVAQGYKTVNEKSVFVKFISKDEPNTFYLAWTTTPWTLPSNVALCMHPDENYVKIKVKDEFYILAEQLAPSLFAEYEIVDTKKGREYEGREYIPLFDWAKPKEKAYYVVNDTYVTLTDGSGIVHIAPAFGEDDSQIGKRYGLPFVQMVNERGKFVAEAGEIAGVDAKKADSWVLQNLASRNLNFKEMMYEHSYPHCWRCDTPLLYYARSSWFIKMTEVRDQLVANNKTVNWYPKAIGEGRFGNFLEGVIDWGVSRERYWGTPLPVWTCDHCDNMHVMGSKQEMKDLCGIEGDIELHRPYIDQVTYKCPICGGTMRRVPEVVDCWFDSGSMPFAQYHFPFENVEEFQKRFPADFISEAVDQTRGWFYTLMAISTVLFDKAPFKNCIVMGHVGDKDGVKMSKHKGNVVAPNEALDSCGADAIRWYFYTSSAPWLPSRYYQEAVAEAQRKYMGTLWNTYAFFVLYANIDNFDPTKYDLKTVKLTLMDKWILSKLNTLIKEVDDGLTAYNITDSAKKISSFTDELSNWYVRRCRERFWGSGMTDDKIAAFKTLHEVLVNLAKVTAPFTPFIADELYQNLVRSVDEKAPISIHLTRYPTCDESMIDKSLEDGMEDVLDVVVLGRAGRNQANIKNRQPLAKMYFGGKAFDLSAELKSVIADELNVKTVEKFVSDEEFITYELKPQLRTLGKIYGKSINAIKEYLAHCDADSVVKLVRGGEKYKFVVDGGVEVEVALDDLLISSVNKPGFIAQSDKGVTVVLDTNLNDDLIAEGFERELVSKLQTMRKEADFCVTDRIIVGYKGTETIDKVFETRGQNIAKDVLADTIGENLSGYQKEWDINGESVTLSVEVKK
ncbi:MAG: isoleucine--tRNA ligase, partial [Clostridia bacterium]